MTSYFSRKLCPFSFYGIISLALTRLVRYLHPSVSNRLSSQGDMTGKTSQAQDEHSPQMPRFEVCWWISGQCVTDRYCEKLPLLCQETVKVSVEFKAVKVLAGFFDSLSSLVEVTMVYIRSARCCFFPSVVQSLFIWEKSQLSNHKSTSLRLTVNKQLYIRCLSKGNFERTFFGYWTCDLPVTGQVSNDGDLFWCRIGLRELKQQLLTLSIQNIGLISLKKKKKTQPQSLWLTFQFVFGD